MGFSAGVMLAASFWSLLQPAIDLAINEGLGSLCYLPAATGFIVGAIFIIIADYFFPQQTAGQTFWCLRYRGRFNHDGSVRPLPRVSSRLWLLLLAITVHNFPEGLAVGVAFGTETTGSSSESFVNLALGMAIQNFPEGLAVSLPLRAAGFSFWRSFWYGQLSGFVEPIAGVLGCLAVQYVHILQPYALGFAAGAMIFVVFDDVIPEANRK
ncbi:unnamed protein product [Mesocestoides corti]|uniref:Zinc transporter ZIP11 n=1 Tax=Mesocestoides corti TaxID=53468 RepID=A0A3P6GRP9_MESCO|nr:unnamed protein product [Mesocestoides corti]